MKALCSWRACRRSRSRGIALLVVLAYVALAALAAAGLLRDATGSQQVLYPLAQDRLAQQMAEIGLRTCEAMLLQPDSQRVTAVQEASIQGASVPQNTRYAGTAWTKAANWASSATHLVVTEIGTDGTTWTAPDSESVRQPECRVELMSLNASTDVVYLVTARGFSPGYTEDTQGQQTGGSVVWLQSLLSLSP